MNFTNLNDALAQLGTSGSSENIAAVMQELLKMKAARRDFVAMQQQARNECDAEKERAEMLHLKLQNLHYKREKLLCDIRSNEDVKTPNTDAIVKEMISSTNLGVKKYSDTKDLKNT